ncbi:hypothetical protein H6P81_003125 [Aristolochia fimbriata]|uniref:ERAD-associated E3 ubiquitin-protein ligase component HRD3A n=1 Tax=Aristolochia fimbriata TaxID=158543 RepID=A0AAV7FBN7_ARIFI|nr:hypothetical protein H6P81_003125 [Aristolochia fimbriata]
MRLLPHLLLLSLLLSSISARHVVLYLSPDDFKDTLPADVDLDTDWEDFPDSAPETDHEVDPGSWRSVVDGDFPSDPSSSPDDSLYASGVNKMISAVSSADPRSMDDSVSDIEAAAQSGNPHAQSTLAFLYGTGSARDLTPAKAFLYHHFAADNGNMQSKMALAYTYHRQEMYDKSVKLYSELAGVAISSALISKESPVLEPVRIHSGVEENKEALRKSRGEEEEDFQITEYQAQRGNAGAMYRIGIYYYYGLRGVRRDEAEALYWLHKAGEKGEPRSMELLGEIYAMGAGLQKNYTKALEWLTLAIRHQHFSAYNGLGYLYVKGYGVEKNYTKAREFFEKAVENEETAALYNLGVMYLKGYGVKRDIKLARKFIFTASTVGQPKAFYHLAKMCQKGVGFKENLQMASALFKLVAERGPWGSLSKWALDSYIKGEVGKALLLYSRLAEMGYEVAQSNAAWILDKYGEHSTCMGELGFCTDAERHQRAHSLWWQASEQGNEHAALLIGDAYYYGRGTDKDYERAAEAYLHAHSQSNAQAMFNLGYMHEHGQGLPLDLHLAKRYYDQALETDPAAKLPVTLALGSLWIRKSYPNSFLVELIDSLPQIYPKVVAWVDEVIMDEGNATILTLVVCLLTVLYLRDRQRRNAAVLPPQPNEVPN